LKKKPSRKSKNCPTGSTNRAVANQSFSFRVTVSNYSITNATSCPNPPTY